MPLPHEPASRLAALRATGLLGPDTSPLLDSLARLAVRLLDVPMAAVSLVDDRQQWWVGYVGPTATAAPASESPAHHSFCREVVERAAPVVVRDTLTQSSVSGGTTRTVRAYAGVPLTLSTGQTLGALCATDSAPRTWDDGDVRILEDLARAAVAELELRISLTARIASEARLTGIIDSATDAILTTDEAQRIVLVNPAAEQLFGYAAHELIGHALDILIPEGQRRRHRAHVEQFATDGTSTRAMGGQRVHESALLSARRRDGSTFPIDASISQVVTDEGRLFTVILRDVSARVSADEALRHHQALLANAEKIGRVGGWAIDLQTGLTTWTDGVYDIYELEGADRLTVDEGIGYYTPASRPLIEQAVQRAIEQGEPFDLELEIITAKGNRRSVQAVGKADPERGNVTGFFQDITERKRVEMALQESERNYRALATATSDVSYRMSADWSTMLPLDGRDLVASSEASLADWAWLYQNIPTDEHARVRQAISEAVAQQALFELEHRVRRPDGSVGWTRSRAVPVLDANGTVTAWFGTASDITAKISLEAQLRQAQKMEAVGQLAGGVAHDFNNLLTVILGNLSLVESVLAVDHPARTELEEVGMAADRASTLVRQLLTFSRQQPVRPEDVHITDVVHHAEKLLRRVIGEEITLTLSLTDEPTLVRADPGQLDQVLMNLAVNARDAMLTPLHGHAGRGGTLHIEVDALTLTSSDARGWEQLSPGRWVRLVVRDSGHGMDMETQAHLFEPFFTTKAVGTGTGLGLSTVFGIVRQAGGAMRVDSRLGQGSAFTILLPALLLKTSGDTQGSNTMPVSVPSAQATVLLVEDESAVRVTARRILERHGYTVLEARNGADALVVWRAHRDQINVVVTDQRMPELGGLELIAHLLADRPDVPVVMMSGYSERPAISASHRHVVTLDKPFSVAGLLAAITTAVPSVGEHEVMAPDV